MGWQPQSSQSLRLLPPKPVENLANTPHGPSPVSPKAEAAVRTYERETPGAARDWRPNLEGRKVGMAFFHDTKPL